LSAWEGLPGEARALASTIKRNIQFEARLIEDLLDVARINRNRIVLSLETADAHELVQEAIDICRPSAEGRKQTLTVSLLADEHHVKADRSRLRQVFWNLLTNAIKFTPAGGEIIVRSVNTPEGLLRIGVRDSGKGMDADVLESLFAPFDRHSPEADSRGGLGLGLSICKGIIAAHEGQIWATSEGPQHGSTFAVELATVAGPAVKLDNASTIDDRAPLPERPRVLVVEDDADSRGMIVTFLSKYGYDAEAAATFDEAMEHLDQAWDVVLTDLSLPGGSGLDIARRALSLERPPQRLIAFSGYGSADDLRVSRDAGFDDHLVKPLDLDGLLKAVGRPGHRPDDRKVSAISSFRARAKRT
jgi:CheY-like chemotaxis protein